MLKEKDRAATSTSYMRRVGSNHEIMPQRFISSTEIALVKCNPKRLMWPNKRVTGLADDIRAGILKASASVQASSNFKEARHSYLEGFLKEHANPMLHRARKNSFPGDIVMFIISRELNPPIGGKQTGVTISQIQEFSAERKLCKAKYIPVLVGLMLFFGAVMRVPAEHDRREKRYMMTDFSYRMARRILSVPLKAADILTGRSHFTELLQGDVGFLAALSHAQLVAPHNADDIRAVLPETQFFYARTGGLEAAFLLEIMLQRARREEQETVNFNFAAMAKKLSIGRVQLHRIMKAFSEEGYVKLYERGGNLITIDDSLVDFVDRFVAMILAFTLANCGMAEDIYLKREHEQWRWRTSTQWSTP